MVLCFINSNNTANGYAYFELFVVRISKSLVCLSPLPLKLQEACSISRSVRFIQTAQNLSLPFEEGYIAEISILLLEWRTSLLSLFV
jgi:hypothetical protein